MPNTMMIKGKVETIIDDEDFARLIGEHMGYDAEQYFREHWSIDYVLRDLTDDQMLEYCSGECSKVEDAIEYWTGILHEMQEELESIQLSILHKTKDEIAVALIQLIQKINAEL